jgi:hypothetical protein
MTFAALMDELRSLRYRLDSVFAADTAVSGTARPECPSAGHCAAVAILVRAKFGGEFVSAKVQGQSHWFNRISVDEGSYDFDITGDQFEPFARTGAEFAASRLTVDDVIGRWKDTLWPETRLRTEAEVNEETRERSRLLSERLDAAEKSARDQLKDVTLHAEETLKYSEFAPESPEAIVAADGLAKFGRWCAQTAPTCNIRDVAQAYVALARRMVEKAEQLLGKELRDQ